MASLGSRPQAQATRNEDAVRFRPESATAGTTGESRSVHKVLEGVATDGFFPPPHRFPGFDVGHRPGGHA